MSLESLSKEEKFKKNYSKVLADLDALHNGVYDKSDSESAAALCLITLSSLIEIQASSELMGKAYKRDIEFKKAEVYADLRSKGQTDDGKKLTEAALTQFVSKNKEVYNLFKDQNEAEKQAKELNNIILLLKDAHILFRSFAKKGE